MSADTCRRFVVSGRVQGVFFRGATREQALALGLRGRAVNLADGRVEVVACGGQAALDALARWLEHGPPLARVERVETASHAEPLPSGFTTG